MKSKQHQECFYSLGYNLFFLGFWTKDVSLEIAVLQRDGVFYSLL